MYECQIYVMPINWDKSIVIFVNASNGIANGMNRWTLVDKSETRIVQILFFILCVLNFDSFTFYTNEKWATATFDMNLSFDLSIMKATAHQLAMIRT